MTTLTGVDRCLACGQIIPEGRQVCRACSDNTEAVSIHRIRQALQNARNELNAATAWLALIDHTGGRK